MNNNFFKRRNDLLIRSLKVPLYLVSIMPLLFSWISSGYLRPLIFVLSIIFVLFSQFLMNAEMDRLDLGYGMKCISYNSIIPVGPCIFCCLNEKSVRKAETLSMGLMIIAAVLVIVITKLISLIAIGLLAIILMFAYLYPPIRLYRRGLGEIATFFDFGPLLLLGSYYAFTGSIPYLLISQSLGFGLIASAVRLSHHIIEEPETSIRKRLYTQLFFAMIVASSLLLLFPFSIVRIILLAISISVGLLPLKIRDNGKVSLITIAFLVIYTVLALPAF